MPKEESGGLTRQGRALVKQSKQLCDVSRERIERGTRLRENGGRRASRANGARPGRRRAERTRKLNQEGIEMPAPSAELLAKAEAASIRFLDKELEAGLSFARMVAHLRSSKKAHARNTERARRYIQYARLAYDTAFSYLPTAKGTTEQLREINLKMAELREMLGPDGDEATQ